MSFILRYIFFLEICTWMHESFETFLKEPTLALYDLLKKIFVTQI